jgi:hypothetical protein
LRFFNASPHFALLIRLGVVTGVAAHRDAPAIRMHKIAVTALAAFTRAKSRLAD